MQDPRSERYDFDFWGKAGGRRKPGRKKPAASNEADVAQLRVNNVRDLQQCRELLLAMEIDDLRGRLLGSRWNFPSGSFDALRKAIDANRALDDLWLSEAADAFGVPTTYTVITEGSEENTKKKKGQKKQQRKRLDEIAEELVQKVWKAQQRMTSAAATEDLHRCLRAAEEMKGAGRVCAEAKLWEVCIKGCPLPELEKQVLVRSCPEELRAAVVQAIVSKEGRPPNPSNECEDLASEYVESALRRRHVGDHSGEQLSLAHVTMWEEVFMHLPADKRPSWKDDWVLLQASEYFARHDHLNVRRRPNADGTGDPLLAEGLRVVRKALYKDHISPGLFMIRRQLVADEIAKWETALPKGILWQTVRERGQYVPGSDIEGSRHVWPRTPFLPAPCPCYLCGADFQTKPELAQHWREQHITQEPEERDRLDHKQIEEEIRKRLFWGEAMEGPFEVRGQEHRRIVGAHATHQTMSVPGSGGINFQKPTTYAASRHLSGCAVCARSFWAEDLFEMDLFARPEEQRQDSEQPADDAESDAPPPVETTQRRFAVAPPCAAKVNALLSIKEYARRWPKIPKHELFASSVQHPHKPEWRWLLHTRRVGDLSLDENGRAPPVHVCHECGKDLSGTSPNEVFMPKYALANDNWIGRRPFPLAPGGEPLREMETKSLARGRMCVNKVIAEPERRGPRDGRQRGLLGNSIAFPQAKVELLQSSELPPPPEEAARFLSESVVIALAGADVEDLHNAKFAEVRRQPYVDAARFLTQHNLFNGDMSVNEERAATEFAEAGRTSDAVLQQAVPLDVSEFLKHRLSGPADTGVAGVEHEQVAAVDGEAVESDEEDDEDPHTNAALPDEEFPEEVLPPMRFCADELTSGDLDELQAIYKVSAELESMQERVRKNIECDVASGLPKKRVRALQTAARDLLNKATSKAKHRPSAIERCAEELEQLEQHASRAGGMPWEGYVQGTGSKPLSMYGPEQWAMCFPDLFPYGDGVFGLARRQALTFQQCVGMHLLREELSYRVTPELYDEARTWFAGRAAARDVVIDASVVIDAGQQHRDEDAAHEDQPSRCSTCCCQQCVKAVACQNFAPPPQPRWGASLNLVCCYYDSWRRMEQIRKARGHVRRSGFGERLERVCNASAEKIDATMHTLGAEASIKDVLRSPSADPDVKSALLELMIFTSEVIGSDGARARLRHEQNGFGLMFGAAGGFLTPNMADVRSPLLVHLHGAGGEERFQVNLLEEEPDMPSAREMLHIVAKDPVAQARFFILSMRLFCEHVLGTGPFDSWLRHNGWLNGAAFPDGFAASGLGGAFAMLAAMHGPIEEQARLSIHPHILLWFVHNQSEQWLRSILKGQTEEARQKLRTWQEKVLAAVQSMQLDSAAVLPLLLTEEPEQPSMPQNTPFSEQHQADCRFDGKLEGDLNNPERRRPLLASAPLFEDHHLRRKRESMPASSSEFDRYAVPQTGAQLCRLPHYRLLQPITDDDLETEEGRKAEAAAYRTAYAEDYRQNIAVGQMHEHKDTCFKYVTDKAVRFAKHCRFHFCHFVRLWLRGRDLGGCQGLVINHDPRS